MDRSEIIERAVQDAHDAPRLSPSRLRLRSQASPRRAAARAWRAVCFPERRDGPRALREALGACYTRRARRPHGRRSDISRDPSGPGGRYVERPGLLLRRRRGGRRREEPRPRSLPPRAAAPPRPRPRPREAGRQAGRRAKAAARRRDGLLPRPAGQHGDGLAHRRDRAARGRHRRLRARRIADAAASAGAPSAARARRNHRPSAHARAAELRAAARRVTRPSAGDRRHGDAGSKAATTGK